MEDIYQILVFVMIAVIGIAKQFVGKREKPEETPLPEDVLTDMFPEVTEKEQPVLQQVKVERPKPVRKKRYTPTMDVVSPAPSVKKAPTSEPQKPNRQSVRLSNREEARRAFIYSEIFNRKY